MQILSNHHGHYDQHQMSLTWCLKVDTYMELVWGSQSEFLVEIIGSAGTQSVEDVVVPLVGALYTDS